MDDFERELTKNLKDPTFKAEWDAIQPEIAIAQAMIEARELSGMTQQKLAEKTGIASHAGNEHREYYHQDNVEDFEAFAVFVPLFVVFFYMVKEGIKFCFNFICHFVSASD